LQGVKSDVTNWQQCLIEGYTHSLGVTPLLDSLVFEDFIGIVARGFIWKQRGDARLASSSLLRGRGRRWACSGLDHMWSELRRCHVHQCSDEAPGGAEETVATEQQFCFVFAYFLQISTIVHSVVLPTIFEKYIHTKIETNLLKSVAYKTLDIHMPLFNPLLGELFYCKASSNQMLPIGNIA